jgi:hypothetical protein
MKPRERARAIREAFAGGRSPDELAVEFGVSVRTVHRVVTGAVFPEAGGPVDVHRRPGRPRIELPSARTCRRVRQARENGATLDQLAKAVGCSVWTIRRILTEG